MERLVARQAAPACALIFGLATLGCGGDEPANEACKSYVARVPAAEIAKTPRENMSAEVLAIVTDDTFVASDASYERIAGELDAIRKLEPATLNIEPRSLSWTDFLNVRLTDSSEAAAHETLDCPNLAYGGKLVQVQSGGALIDFAGKRFNTRLLSEEYESLPNVEDAGGESLLYDGPDVCLEVQGDLHLYIFDEASGDCPAGCMNHKYYGFAVAPGPAVTSLGTYDPASGDPEPVWYTKSTECLAGLTQI